MNPILNQMMSGMMNANGGLMNMFRLIKTAQNPQAMMQNMMQSNPQLNQVMSMVNQNGGNAKQLFYSMCQQRGVDPDTIINSLKQM